MDTERANAARIYDFLLGGAHNFAVDRDRAEAILAGHPDIRRSARENRAYLGRVVRRCLEQGITQFLDLGSGVPTVGNVHEIAQASVPTARVAYVDVEPVAVAHAEEILAGNEYATVTRADMRDADTVLAAPGVATLLDFDRPVAVLALAVLHFVDDGVAEILERYRRVLAPGSVLAVSHSSDDTDDPELAERMRAMREALQGSASEGTLRSRAELREVLAGFELEAPGLVDVTAWPKPRPDVDPVSILAAVGRVPD